MFLVYTQNMLRLSININRNLLRTPRTVQLAKYNFSCLAHNSMDVSLRNNFLFNVHKHSRVYGVYVVRHQSTLDLTIKDTVPSRPESVLTEQTENTIANVHVTEANKSFISEIPDPPIPLIEEITAVAEAVDPTVEPTLASLGLGGYWPPGIVQSCLEWLHISCGMPWWEAIATLTIIVKLLMIRPSITATKNNVKMVNTLPEMMKIQNKLTEARNCGNREEAAIYAYELDQFRRKNDISILSPINLFVRLILQIPVFIALTQMARLPVESLKTGGLWWFTDLTTVDQYYLLPLLSSIGIYLVITNTTRSSPSSFTHPILPHLMKLIPVGTFLFTMNLPGAVLCYWVLSNFITIIQNEILKIKRVKAFLNIPDIIEHKDLTGGILKKKNFMESFNESWTNMKISNQMANHLRADEAQFNEAARRPLKKTFKYNPKLASVKASIKSAAAIKK